MPLEYCDLLLDAQDLLLLLLPQLQLLDPVLRLAPLPLQALLVLGLLAQPPLLLPHELQVLL